MERSSGILMPMSSLPSPYGIGTMGKEAYKFVDFLKAAGQKYWQILPLGPTSYGDSPYASPSTYAGNPYFIDPDMLIKDGLLKKSDVARINWGEDPRYVDYGKIYENRFSMLRKAYAAGKEKFAGEVSDFADTAGPWLENYALFMSLKAKFGMISWTEWPDEEIRLRKPEALEAARKELKDDVEFWIFVQFLFFRQWNALRAYARENGIYFIGDVPIYVALDSADVWSEPQFFQLDEENLPTEISGCPPDDFTADGQLWGNPLYDYEKMQADGFGWWIRRIDGVSRLYDVIRIDHFRGFESYWAVPYGDKTARNGVWRKGPGMNLVGVLTSWFPNITFIAEDLGYPTPGVKKLLADSGLPGMKVLEFAFDVNDDSVYLPHNCHENSSFYLGTHDNNTVLGWVDTLTEKEKKFAVDYMHITESEGWCWGMIRSGMSCPSKLFVVQMQDLLELPGSCRMNTPGNPIGNWRWRMQKGAATKELAKKLRYACKLYRRLPKEAEKPAKKKKTEDNEK